MLKTYPILFVALPLSLLILPQVGIARLNTVTAGVSTGYDYTETRYDRDSIDPQDPLPSDNKRSKKISIGPVFIIESSSSIDKLSINYKPSYSYDFDNSKNDIDQNFSLTGYRNFTKELRFDVSDKFIYSDDPNLVTDNSSSDYNKGRKRYWTNTFELKSTYTYDNNSFFGGGYSYRVLKNDDTGIGGYEDYDKHTADLFLTHRFNSSWNMESSVSYTRGLFDPPDQQTIDIIGAGLESVATGSTADIDSSNLSNDLSEYRAQAAVNWIVSPSKTIQTRYNFSASNYEAILRNDSRLHNLSLGGKYQHSKRLSFSLGGGPSYEKTETFSPNWNYNAYLNCQYAFSKRTSFSASAEKSYDQNNFSSNNTQFGRDQGLTEFVNWQVDFSHELFKDFTLTVFASYRDEKQEDLVHGIVTVLQSGTNIQDSSREQQRELSTFNRDIYRSGITLKYNFMQHWTTALLYNYRRQNSERINDSYDENRAYLTLSVENEIFRW